VEVLDIREVLDTQVIRVIVEVLDTREVLDTQVLQAQQVYLDIPDAMEQLVGQELLEKQAIQV
jgi:hypothetical protein